MLKPTPPPGAPPQPQPTPPTLGQQQSMGPQAVVRPGQCANKGLAIPCYM